MTKIEELEQKLNEMERELKNTVNAIEENMGGEISELRDELAELKESKKEGKWKPNYNEVYWYRSVDGLLHTGCYTNDYDEWRIENLPIFPTKEACERYWHFMDTVKEKSYEFSKEEWEKGNSLLKYYIEFWVTENKFCVEHCAVTKGLGAIYFKSFDDAQYIIDNFKDELMEFWI